MDSKAVTQQAIDNAKQHYENFPVAPIFIAKHLRKPISLIYHFARTADDFADEGNDLPSCRLEKLANYQKQLEYIKQGRTDTTPFFTELAKTIKKFNLPIEQFEKLLKAFKQDVLKHRYQSFAEVLNYCSNSADPIGHLLLCLHNKATKQNIYYSNLICTALQLINFLQDLHIDIFEKKRLYLARDVLVAHKITEQDIFNKQKTTELQTVSLHYLAEIRKMLITGSNLKNNLDGSFKLYIKIVLSCAKIMCNKLQHRKIVYTRPKLAITDLPVIGLTLLK